MIPGLWHRWLAWHPVWTADRGWVWLRHVERRLLWYPPEPWAFVDHLYGAEYR